MNKKYIPYATVFLLLLSLVSVYSYFRVDGHEIDSISAISEEYTATVTKTHGTLAREKTEYVLSSEQVLLLKELILDGSYTRRLSFDYSYTGLRDTYQITLECTAASGKQVDFISIHCVENLYLQIRCPYGEKDFSLKNRDASWYTALEAILAAS